MSPDDGKEKDKVLYTACLTSKGYIPSYNILKFFCYLKKKRAPSLFDLVNAFQITAFYFFLCKVSDVFVVMFLSFKC